MKTDKSLKTTDLGRMGEDRAVIYLESLGYSVLERNYFCEAGEIDIVARDREGCLVFVEVKTRRSEAYGSAISAVGKSKLRKITQTAYHYVKNYEEEQDMRIEVVSVTFGMDVNIEHTEVY